MSSTLVVSYRNSTSNHNTWHQLYRRRELYLIEILHQTTTPGAKAPGPTGLYLIEILHQTTTTLVASGDFSSCILSKFYIKPQLRRGVFSAFKSCILSKFYIKPQPSRLRPPWLHCCILSKFYIKPQQCPSPVEISAVVSYRNSTSNHNVWLAKGTHKRVVSYRNSTSNHNTHTQEWRERMVVSYRNSTSNHNLEEKYNYLCQLYLIEILHQTTTSGLILIDKVLLTGCLPL